MEPSSAGKYEDILQEGLDRLLSGQESLDAMLAEHPDRADDLRADLQMASLLTNARPEFDPRPGFVGASKARLLRQIAQETHAPRASPSSGLASRFSQWVAFLSRNPRLAYSLVALAVFACSVFLFSGVTLAKAARLAIPGDLIYPVKTAAEDVQLAITPGLAKRAELYIRFAGVRLVELQILAMENRFEYIEPTMRRYENQSRMALDALARLERTDPKTARAIAQEYKRTLEEHTVILAVLAESMPTAFRTMLLDAVALLQATSINVAQIISTATAIIQSTATATDDAAGSVLATITNDLYLFLTRTPTSTLSFSATPTGTVTPTLTATVYNTPTATVTATITSTPQPSPTPTWLPTPTETQKPTKTPKPTKVPKPTKTPKDKD